MSDTATPERPNGRTSDSDGGVAGELVVVTVTETVAPALTGRQGCRYVSPPQPREQAMTLVRLLLGGREPVDGGDRTWVAPIAGGRRVVTLLEEPPR